MRPRSLDLNLLVMLEALVAERSVSSMAWHLLASSGISGAAAGFGRLFDVER
ncbi:MAG TPA: hypothetical protein VHB49_08610 [Bradyrhizobium sp.]|nr:hypothetical protein [Bradyrhizobium sp.]